jgi:hypothetical protein
MSDQVAARSTALQQVSTADPGELSRRERKRRVKLMAANDVLPAQRESAVSPDGLFVSPFYTLEAKQIIRHTFNYYTDFYYGSALTAIAGTVITGLITLTSLVQGQGFLFNDTGLNVFQAISTAAILPFPSAVMLKPKANNQVADKMTKTAVEAFKEWAKERYGINILDNSTLEILSPHITAGTKPPGGYPVTDELTKDKYELHVLNDGRIYLTKKGTPQEATKVNEVLAIAANPKLEEVILPDDLTELYDQLAVSIAELRTQELSTETAHAVERTMAATQTVLLKYQKITRFDLSGETHEDVLTFFRKQIQFVDSLIQDHVRELRKELMVELVTMDEATRLNSLQLEGNK